MGKISAKRPARLAEKLIAIRTGLQLSQNDLIRYLGVEDELTQSQVSAFERGTRLPSLLIILGYARLARVSTDILIDDELNLPKTKSSKYKS